MPSRRKRKRYRRLMGEATAATPAAGQGFTMFADPNHEREDLRMLRSAIKRRWPIPRELRRLALCKIEEILQSKTTSERDQIAAIKALLTADSVNLRREEIEAKRDTPLISIAGEAKIQVIEVVAPASHPRPAPVQIEIPVPQTQSLPPSPFSRE